MSGRWLGWISAQSVFLRRQIAAYALNDVYLLWTSAFRSAGQQGCRTRYRTSHMRQYCQRGRRLGFTI
jgi:hypothetical protein